MNKNSIGEPHRNLAHFAQSGIDNALLAKNEATV